MNKTVKSFLATAGLILLALLLKSNTIELFKIPTGSMEPTLYGAKEMGRGFGDHIFVLRCAYGFNCKIKVPIVDWTLPLPEGYWMLPFMHLPKVGDVVVFEKPDNRNIDYIKRCAGTPGDRVRIKDGRLYVNDVMITNRPATASYVRYTCDGIFSRQLQTIANWMLKIEQSTGNKEIYEAMYIDGVPFLSIKPVEGERNYVMVGNRKVHVLKDEVTPEVRVPENCFFMLGDNSAHSSDSRFWGFAGRDTLKGRALCIYLPFKRIGAVR
ncbi:signal peptidase I [bacterium]|nr:signal peptidase I [bacterium]